MITNHFYKPNTHSDGIALNTVPSPSLPLSYPASNPCLLTLMIKKQPTLQQLKHRRNHYHSLLFTSKPQARPLIRTKIKQLTQQIQDLEAQLRKEL